MKNNNRTLLISLLTEAAAEMKKLGNNVTPWSRYDTCQDLGAFIEKASSKLATGDEEDIKELWGIFAPTSDWDDSGGSVTLANKIFELLNKLYRDKILKKVSDLKTG